MVQLAAVVAALFYPFAIYFGLNFLSPATLGGLLAAVVLLRVLLSDMSSAFKGLMLIVVVSLLVLHRWMHDDQQLLKFYPVAVNFIMLVVFSSSLLQAQPLIEKIALSRNMDVGEHNRRYLRILTIVWSLFFVFNVIASAWTALYATMNFWLLYNGFISYLLIGALVGCELIYRRFHKSRMSRLT